MPGATAQIVSLPLYGVSYRQGLADSVKTPAAPVIHSYSSRVAWPIWQLLGEWQDIQDHPGRAYSMHAQSVPDSGFEQTSGKPSHHHHTASNLPPLTPA